MKVYRDPLLKNVITLAVTGILGGFQVRTGGYSFSWTAGDLELLRSSSQESDKEAGKFFGDLGVREKHLQRRFGKFLSQQEKMEIEFLLEH